MGKPRKSTDLYDKNGFHVEPDGAKVFWTRVWHHGRLMTGVLVVGAIAGLGTATAISNGRPFDGDNPLDGIIKLTEDEVGLEFPLVDRRTGTPTGLAVAMKVVSDGNRRCTLSVTSPGGAPRMTYPPGEVVSQEGDAIIYRLTSIPSSLEVEVDLRDGSPTVLGAPTAILKYVEGKWVQFEDTSTHLVSEPVACRLGGTALSQTYSGGFAGLGPGGGLI